MMSVTPGPGHEVDEADFVDQQLAIDPDEVEEPEGDPGTEADEADWIEQRIEVPLDEDGPDESLAEKY